MTLTRYWHFDHLPPCRPGVALALVHFALLAFTLLGLYRQETEEEPATRNVALPPLPMPERELAAYAGPYFTLMLPSKLMQIVLSHMDAWKANQERLIMALRLCEGEPKTDAPVTLPPMLPYFVVACYNEMALSGREIRKGF